MNPQTKSEPLPRPPTTTTTTRLRLPKRHSSWAARATTKHAAWARSTRPTTRSSGCSPSAFKRSTARSTGPCGNASCRSSCSRAARQQTPSDVAKVMEDSLAVMRKHVQAGTNMDENKKVPQRVLDDLGAVGYWGLLVDKQHGGSGAPFVSFAPFLTKMAMVDPTVAGLASVHGCIGAVDPVRTFGNPEQKQRFLPDLASGKRLSAFALTEPVRRLRSDRAAHHGRKDGDDVRRQRREAVHHQRRARSHDRPGLPDRQAPRRAHRRSADRRKTNSSNFASTACGP